MQQVPILSALFPLTFRQQLNCSHTWAHFDKSVYLGREDGGGGLPTVNIYFLYFLAQN